MTGLPLNVDWQQILLHLFNFTILFGALYILLYKPVKDFMDNRTAHYAEMDSKAEKALADAESSKASYEQKERDLDDEIRAKKSSLTKEIDAERERRIEAARGEAEKIIANARGEADREKKEIIESAQKEITEMVTDAMEKLTLEQSASDAFDQFLDAAEEASK